MVKLLVNTWTDMEVTFLEGKTSHSTLWNRIAETMSREFRAHVTGKDCNYKFKAEKKKWRDVKNNNSTSGRARKSYPHSERFQTVYGQRACEEPVVIVDSMEPRPVRLEAGLARRERQPQKKSAIVEAFINDT